MTIGFLASYVYHKTVDMREFKGRLGGAPVFGDSGAFSAHNVGMAVSVEGYAKWAWRWHDVFDVVANLDVIHNEKGSAKNLERLRGYGLSPMPVFHRGVGMDAIKAEVDRGTPYIALGGLVTRENISPTLDWIEQVFATVPESVDVHGFGFTKIQYLTRWPWKSVDSSSWLSGARYNQAMMFDAPNFVRCDLNDAAKRRSMLPLIEEHGGDVERFATGKFHYKDAFVLGAVAMYKASEYWSQQARRQGWKEPVMYLASTDYHLMYAYAAIRRYKRSRSAVAATKPEG